MPEERAGRPDSPDARLRALERRFAETQDPADARLLEAEQSRRGDLSSAWRYCSMAPYSGPQRGGTDWTTKLDEDAIGLPTPQLRAEVMRVRALIAEAEDRQVFRPIDVWCDICGASPGRRCRPIRVEQYKRPFTHRARIRAAERFNRPERRLPGF